MPAIRSPRGAGIREVPAGGPLENPIHGGPTMDSHRLSAAFAVAPLLAQNGDRIKFDVDVSSLLTYVLIGLVVGLLARFLVPGRTSMSLLATIVIGIIG